MLLFLITSAISIIIAITVHEAAHAWMANHLGDPTAKLQGRLSLNPLVHLDPVGTLVLFVTFFRFGWGKPVQFDPYNLQNPKRDAALISLAGPVSNLILAALLSIILRFVFSEFLQNLIILNISLAVFNLVPVHPLDGGKILVGILPHHEARQVDLFLAKYGLIILVILILPIWNGLPLVSIITGPVINFLSSLLLTGFAKIY